MTKQDYNIIIGIGIISIKYNEVVQIVLICIINTKIWSQINN